MSQKIAYRVDEAAALLSISRSSMFKHIARGEVCAVKRGRSTRILASELMKFVRSWQPVISRPPRPPTSNY